MNCIQLTNVIKTTIKLLSIVQKKDRNGVKKQLDHLRKLKVGMVTHDL